MSEKRNRMSRKKKILIIAVTIIIILAGAFFLYTGIYYHADASADEALQSSDRVTVTDIGEGWFFDGPGVRDALIFYPGAKVEEKAYAPFLRLLAEEGIDVFLLRMPFRLAFFGQNRADKVISSYDYSRWFIGGHSLGGAMAALYAAKHKELSGVVLCAAYPTKPLDEEDLELILYGSEDSVLNMKKLAEGEQYASGHRAETEIRGGNHAQFGNYGLQRGDGKALISAEEQQRQAAEFILRELGY